MFIFILVLSTYFFLPWPSFPLLSCAKGIILVLIWLQFLILKQGHAIAIIKQRGKELSCTYLWLYFCNLWGQILNKRKQKKIIMVRMTDGNKFTCRLTDMDSNTLRTCMMGFFPGRDRVEDSRFTDNWRGRHINEQDSLLEIYTVTRWSQVWWCSREAEAAILQGQGGIARPCLRQTNKHTANEGRSLTVLPGWGKNKLSYNGLNRFM